MAPEHKKIIILSSRGGGPFTQFSLIANELRKNSYEVSVFRDFWSWVRLHFLYKKDTIILTNIPFLFRFSKNNFFLNIKGNYRVDRNPTRNPLGYLYGINKMWSEKIIVPCQYLKEKLNIPNALVVPNAVSEPPFLPKKAKEYQEEIRLITITKFFFWNKAKGALNALEALSKVKTDKKIVFDIFGFGTFYEQIKKKAERKNFPANIKVFFRGRTENARHSFEEFGKSDIFIYWSDQDVMPNIFLEAMASGLPIVSNYFPSFPEILGEKNLISKNEDEFAKNIKSLVENEEARIRIGESNLLRAKNFSIKKTIKQWMNILQN